MKIKFLILFVFILIGVSSAKEWKPPYDFIKAKVVKVIDGDTIVVKIRKVNFNDRKTFKNLRFSIRLIGVDTPESKPNRRAEIQSKEAKKDIRTIIYLGKKAKEFTEKNLLVGKKGRKKIYKYVYLEFDVEVQDRYGRLLAYVWLPNGEMLNKKIICSGYAYPLTVPPNVKYEKEFLKCFREARKHRRGLWK